MVSDAARRLDVFSSEPVRFSGDDATQFLEELPAALGAAELRRLGATVASGIAAMASGSANDFFR